MKRLNKIQLEIEGLAKRVPQLTKRQTEWAIHNFAYYISYYGNKTECTCPNCKGKVAIKEVGEGKDQYTFCPHCGARIRTYRVTEDYHKWCKRIRTNNHQEELFQVLSVVGDWQVTRLFYMQRYCYVKKDNTPWEFYELCQAWNNPNVGTTYFRALPKMVLGGFDRLHPYALHSWNYECTDPDNWAYNKYIECDNVLEPRRPGGANYFQTKNIAPYAKIHPYYKMIGISRRNANKTDYTAIGLFQHLNRKRCHPMLETLLKCGDYELFNAFMSKDTDKASMDILFSAYKICKRNNYDYKKDFNEWKDLVMMLHALGLDYRSPHYVCPEDLHEMHQTILQRRLKVETDESIRMELEGKIDYERRIEKYLDMDIHNEDLDIIVLPNVMAFKDEADHLHHCVFRCKYYERAESLILSARSRKGKAKRWETIEVSLKTFTIKQSYGYGDKHTSKHKEICDLVMANMKEIQKRAKAC